MPLAALALAALIQTGEPDWNALLAPASLTLETAHLDRAVLALYDGDTYVLPAFQAYWQNPFGIPSLARSLQASLAAQQTKPNEVFVTAGRLLAVGTRRTLVGDPTARPDVPLGEAMGRLFARAKKAKPTGLGSTVAKMERLAGPEVAKWVSQALVQMTASMDWRDSAFSQGPGALFARSVSKEDQEQPAQVAAWLKELASYDPAMMLAGAHDLFLSLQKAPASNGKGTAGLHEVATPYGVVAIGGTGPNTYPNRPYLLIVDLGGDDLYLGGGRTSSVENGVSAIVDLGGNDKYVSDGALATQAVALWPQRKGHSEAGPGGAICGMAGIIDLGGNDVYRTAGPGLGAARYGAAMLWDAKGDDVYDGYVDSQGAGSFGVGLLVDSHGNDTYDCFVNSQGFAGTMGAGMLLDCQGNDRYTANDTVLDFPSAQSAEHNGSCSQGAGFGRRADYSDGHSMGGGFGVLADLNGDDTYSCGIFGQGVGYWKAVGLLLDGQGNDQYSGHWYVQGSAAHFAVGGLFDAGGNDRYTSTMNMSAGAGHDFSIGWLHDSAGNDVYKANTLSLGAANANGIGIFYDAAGDDSYSAPRIAFGWATDPGAGSAREFALSFGLFVDAGGTDRYQTELGHVTSGDHAVTWTRRNDPPGGSQVGIFWDR